MSTKSLIKRVALLALCGATFPVALPFLADTSGAAEPSPPTVRSRIVSWKDAASNKGDWGEMRTYFHGRTLGTKDAFAAVAVVEPGKAVHRAHRHVEEEYLIISEGSGMWLLDGKEISARKGDILYVEPWVYHGLTNTGKEPLTFIVIKYNGKDAKLPPRPDSRKDEL